MDIKINIDPSLYKSTKDYILVNIFNTEKELSNDKIIAKEPLVKLNHFDICRFRYQIEPNTFHYIMWYTCSKNELTDEEITKNVEESIYNVIKTDKFNFVWYENPKMTINDIYHVQVFWINYNLGGVYIEGDPLSNNLKVLSK